MLWSVKTTDKKVGVDKNPACPTATPTATVSIVVQLFPSVTSTEYVVDTAGEAIGFGEVVLEIPPPGDHR